MFSYPLGALIPSFSTASAPRCGFAGTEVSKRAEAVDQEKG
ncbi:hypothetical protein [Mycolicibacterium komossense]|nr:hypothetical protein [Mycolicibacterium komossense]